MQYIEQKKQNINNIIQAPFGDEDGKVSYYPRYIQLEHTSFCNAECIMCNHFYIGNRGAKMLSPEVIELLEPVFPYVEMVMMNGDGEPFLHPQLITFAGIYQKYGIITATNTNLCSIRLGNGIYRECFDALSLSCDGASKETFEMIRKGLSFERFRENLKVIREEMPGARLAFDVVMMKENVLELAEIVALAAQYNIGIVQFNLLGTNPEIGNEEDALWDCMDLTVRELHRVSRAGELSGVLTAVPAMLPKTFDEAKASAQEERIRGMDFRRLIKERQERAKDQIKCGIGENRLHIETVPGDYSFTSGSEDPWCSWGLERCYIDLNGNISTCCFNVHHHMGNLIEAGSFEKVWNGENYRLFRKKMKQGIMPYWCKNCSWRRNNECSMEVGKDIPVKKNEYLLRKGLTNA